MENPDEKWIQHHRDVYKQTNQASIDFSIKTLQSLFLLNGAAATAILGAKIEPFFAAGVLFAFGALLASIAFAVSYFYNLMVSETWKPEYGYRDKTDKIFHFQICMFSLNLSDQDVEKARIYPILPAVCSGLCALTAIGYCWAKL